MRRWAFTLAGLLLATVSTSCDGGGASPGVTASSTPTTAIEATGPSVSLDIDGFAFTAMQVDGNLVKLWIDAPDGTRHSQQVRVDADMSVRSSPPCLRREGDGSSTGNSDTSLEVSSVTTEARCTLEAPVVVWGQAVGPVAYVCVAGDYRAGIGYPWFVEIGSSGLILEVAPIEAPRTARGHNFSASGEHVGGPPLLYIRQACSDLAPWSGGGIGPSPAFRAVADLIYRVHAPEEIAGMWMHFDFGPGGFVNYLDGTRRSTSMDRYKYYSATPTLRVDGVEQQLNPIPPIPDLSQRWDLVITVRRGAVTKDGGRVEIDPSKIEFKWTN